MAHLLAIPAPVALGHKQARSLARVPTRLEQFGRGDAGRAGLEAFIAEAFFQAYGAEVSHFSDTLIGCSDTGGRWVAAVGYSLAASGPTFLEQYLDAPLEVAVNQRVEHPVAREQIVEVGNLAAATHPGAARAVIVRTTDLLYQMGLHLVAFTATPSLLNSFGRLRLQTHFLAPADRSRLPGAGRQWGTYYDHQPQVMFGDIRYGYEKLARLSPPIHATAQ